LENDRLDTFNKSSSVTAILYQQPVNASVWVSSRRRRYSLPSMLGERQLLAETWKAANDKADDLCRRLVRRVAYRTFRNIAVQPSPDTRQQVVLATARTEDRGFRPWQAFEAGSIERRLKLGAR
jgi:hypothetical protein